MDRTGQSSPAHAGEFVSEPLAPVEGAGLAAAAATGEPAVPDRFTWRGHEWELAGVLRKWKTSGPCRHRSAERYLRRHYYQVRVARRDGEYVPTDTDKASARPAESLVLTVYFERQPRRGQSPKARWYVYTIDEVAPRGE
jgi:hypothetical protein